MSHDDPKNYAAVAKLMAPEDDKEDEREIEKEKKFLERPLKWATNGKIYWVTTESVDKIEPGLYTTGVSDNTGPFLAEIHTTTDKLLNLPDTNSSEVIAEVRDFWTKKEIFAKYGNIHKRGIILYGPPGSGKTSTLQQLVRQIVDEYKGIALFISHPLEAAAVLQAIRKVEPDRPVIALMEDIDELIRRHGLVGFLALLDGEAQVNNVLFIATTNYLDQIDPRLTQRPARFDRRILIDMPSANARRAYLYNRIVTLAKEEFPEDELNRWVAATEDFSIAHLRELIVSVKCLGIPFEEAVQIMKDMCLPVVEIEKARKGGLGFTP